jgi:hypothetical protein
VTASTFPIELWVWGLPTPTADGQDVERAHRLALICVTAGLAGAFLPTALLCALLSALQSRDAALPEAVNGALYLSTPLLVALFVVGHLRWRGPPARSALTGRLDAKHDS